MAKQEWKPGNMLYPLPAVLITVSDGEGHENVFTAAWAGTVCTNPPMLSVSVRPERFSHSMMEKTGEFVVNLTTEEMVRAVDFCGVRSGRDLDKFAAAGLRKEAAAHVKAPLLAEAPVSIECSVAQVLHLGSHDLFLAKVLAVHADEAFLDEKGTLRLNRAKLLTYSHGAYFGLGEQLGTFGFSVSRKLQAGRSDEQGKAERKAVPAGQADGKAKKAVYPAGTDGMSTRIKPGSYAEGKPSGRKNKDVGKEKTGRKRKKEIKIRENT